jgi:hypothetical protein
LHKFSLKSLSNFLGSVQRRAAFIRIQYLTRISDSRLSHVYYVRSARRTADSRRT